MPQGIIRLGVVGIISLIWTIMIMFILGCNKHEKNIIINYLRKV